MWRLTQGARRLYSQAPKATYKRNYGLIGFAALAGLGAGAYYYTRPKTAFSQNEAMVVFVLGGPGSGKGTQCANIIKDYNFVHLSAGDLLRAEQNRQGSEYGELIREYIRSGRIVPQEITVALLRNAMAENMKQGTHQFLIDGFPRKMDQAHTFEETVVPSRLTLFFDCSEEVMEKRLLKRGQTSGREDDNIESIKKRFRVFKDDSLPVVEWFSQLGKVAVLPADLPPEEVYKRVKQVFDKNEIHPIEAAMVAVV